MEIALFIALILLASILFLSLLLLQTREGVNYNMDDPKEEPKDGTDGTDGTDGSDGADGADGADGKPAA